MKILFSIHLYLPQHCCGAELMVHQMAKFFQTKGHQIKVLLHQAGNYGVTKIYSWDGVDVFPPDKGIPELIFDWCDCAFTHLDYTKYTVVEANKRRKPVFFITHNTSDYYDAVVNWNKNVFPIYNSEAGKEMLKYERPGFVFNPPCDWRYYDVCDDPYSNEYITLINLNKNKGGEVLREIARLMPDRKFLGVTGSYDAQVLDQPKNVKILPKQVDIREVYKQTRILIMPSQYESWGRTATEAMCNGIPVICNETFGLRENCKDAAIYCGRDNAQEWVKEIKKLDDKKKYAAQSKKVRERSRELDPVLKLEELNEWIIKTVTGWNNRN